MMKPTTQTAVPTRPIALLLAVVLLAMLWAPRTAGADAPVGPESAPPVLNYQGIVRVDGVPFSGPTGYFKFAVVDSATGRGTTNYWANDGKSSGEPNKVIPLPVAGGLFNVLLGDTALTGMTKEIGTKVFATEPTYLRVWFSRTGAPGSFEALEPNQRIASVAYSLRAERADTVDGLHASGGPQANKLVALDDSAHLRVPRVVDSDDTDYYADPASTSNLKYVLGQRFGVNSMAPNIGYDVKGFSGNNIDYGLRVRETEKSGITVLDAGDFGVNIERSNWSGAYVEDTDASGFYVKNAGWGVYVEASTYYGVNARGRTAGGYFGDSDSGKYAYAGYGSYGIYSNGTIRGSGFTTGQAHPTDRNSKIVYGVLEGGEAGTYYRGTARLEKGTAVVELPEHYRLVTEGEGLTVQVTPRADCMGLYVAEVTTRQIVVKELQGGTSNAPFDFFVNGVRAGHAGRQVIQKAADLPPDQAHNPRTGQPDG